MFLDLRCVALGSAMQRSSLLFCSVQQDFFEAFPHIRKIEKKKLLHSSLFAVRNIKKSSWLVTGLWSRGPLKDLEGSKDCKWVQVIPMIIQDQFYTIQNLQRSPIPQTSNRSGTFFCCFLQQTGSSLVSQTFLIKPTCPRKVDNITFQLVSFLSLCV